MMVGIVTLMTVLPLHVIVLTPVRSMLSENDGLVVFDMMVSIVMMMTALRCTS